MACNGMPLTLWPRLVFNVWCMRVTMLQHAVTFVADGRDPSQVDDLCPHCLGQLGCGLARLSTISTAYITSASIVQRVSC